MFWVQSLPPHGGETDRQSLTGRMRGNVTGSRLVELSVFLKLVLHELFVEKPLFCSLIKSNHLQCHQTTTEMNSLHCPSESFCSQIWVSKLV